MFFLLNSGENNGVDKSLCISSREISANDKLQFLNFVL